MAKKKLPPGMERFGPETYSTQMPFKLAKPLEDAGLIRWCGTYLGTQQYALTDKGRAFLKASEQEPTRG